MHRVSFVLLGRIAVLRMSPIVTDETAWSVGLSSVICHNRELPCKNDRTDQDGIWIMSSDGPMVESCVRRGFRSPRQMDNFG